MSVALPRSCHKKYFTPDEPTLRSGCPSYLTPTYRVSSLPQGDRTHVIHDITTMQLVHTSKTGEVKNSLRLDRVHHRLGLDSLVLNGSGASNILLTTVSFDCFIVDHSGEEHREYITFDLRIPGTGTEKEAVFSYDAVEKAYGTQERLYAALEHFYDTGRHKVNAQDHKHGHHPAYDPTSSKHDQYIRHTEQLLVAYLALPQAADMLCNRLRTTIRGKYPGAASAKVYNMGLHMHSTKTCCAPCEYSLLGLMNSRTGLKQNGKRLSFLRNFKRACSRQHEQLTFTLPEKSLIRLVVTVSASEPDAHHKSQPSYTKRSLKRRESVPPFAINVKKARASRHIFMSVLNGNYDKRRVPDDSTLIDKTVGISGSKATSGSSGTAKKVIKARKSELRLVARQLAYLEI